MRLFILICILLSVIYGHCLAFEDDIMYQIFPISFRDSDGDGKGDFNGICEEIPYLQSLNVTAVWMNPVFESHFYHGYGYSSIEEVDSDLGTEEEFWDMVDYFHLAGMEIYLDIVIYALFEDNEYFMDAYNNPDSEYDDWFLFTNDQNTEYTHAYYVGYDGYSGNFVYLNMNNEGLYQYLLEAYSYWLDPNGDGNAEDGVDGFRCDHVVLWEDVEGSGYDAEFWDEFIPDIRSEYPETRFIAENAHWGLNNLYFFYDSEFDAEFASFSSADGMRYFFSPLLNNIGESFYAVYYDLQQYNQTNVLNILDNHDIRRFSSIILDNDDYNKLGAAWLFLGPFPPVIYNGSEIGMRGYRVGDYGSDANDYHMREPFEWQAELSVPPHAQWYSGNPQLVADQLVADNDGISVEEQLHDQSSLLNYYKDMSELRMEHDVFRTGSYVALNNPDSPLTVFMREDSDEHYIVILNQSYQYIDAEIDFTAFFADLAPVEEIVLEDEHTAGDWENITNANLENYQKTIAPYAVHVLEFDYNNKIDGVLNEDAEILVIGEDGVIWWKEINGYIYMAIDVDEEYDAFVFLSENVHDEITAPWLKAGDVGNWDYFCGYEESNGWSGWYDGYSHYESDLFGNVAGEYLEIYFDPAVITDNDSLYVAVGYYVSSENGELVYQIPNGSGDGDISVGQYLAFNVQCADNDENQLEDVSSIHSLNVSPNPFNPETRIEFSLEESQIVEMSIYNIKGQKVDVLMDKMLDAGDYHVIWQADSFASGIYFLRLKAGAEDNMQKLVLLK